jgi:hypothetical protein
MAGNLGDSDVLCSHSVRWGCTGDSGWHCGNRIALSISIWEKAAAKLASIYWTASEWKYFLIWKVNVQITVRIG